MSSVSKLEVIEFKDESELLKQLSDILNSFELMQEFLGVEFAFKDGTFESDGPPEGSDEEDEEWLNQEIDFNVHRPNDYGGECIGFPKSYPAKLCIIQLSYSAGDLTTYARWQDDND